ncbi:MAG: DUF4317 domain-containing protein [Eubacterium sp.]|nr:DUF4317 domain-containing protein [Eubacterium sp.]
MNKKEISEIRRRFKPDYDNISQIFGCYVNAAREIVTEVDLGIGLMEAEEAEMYLKILKKTLSGTMGKNLIDIEFTTAQVESSDEHRLLMALRDSHLRDAGLRKAFYERVIESVNMGEVSYVILIAEDSYDVPYKGVDDSVFSDGSSEVFHYFVCVICPVKDAKVALSYKPSEHNFRSATMGRVLTAPELGFMFPAFDDRSANIYNLLYYSRNTLDIHDEFIENMFAAERAPMSAGVQKAVFGNMLSAKLGDACDLEVVKALHGEIADRLEIHKESKSPELPELYLTEVEELLEENGVPEEKIESFRESCEKEFGDSPVLNPGNLVNTKRFDLTTTGIKIQVEPEYAYEIETRVIDGRRFILIPADDTVEVNGIDIAVPME